MVSINSTIVSWYLGLGQLGVTLDDQLSLAANITVSFLLQIHDLQHQADLSVPHPEGLQGLVQELVILNLDYCNTLPA